MSQSKGNLHSITNQVGRGVRKPVKKTVRRKQNQVGGGNGAPRFELVRPPEDNFFSVRSHSK